MAPPAPTPFPRLCHPARGPGGLPVAIGEKESRRESNANPSTTSSSDLFPILLPLSAVTRGKAPGCSPRPVAWASHPRPAQSVPESVALVRLDHLVPRNHWQSPSPPHTSQNARPASDRRASAWKAVKSL